MISIDTALSPITDAGKLIIEDTAGPGSRVTVGSQQETSAEDAGASRSDDAGQAYLSLEMARASAWRACSASWAWLEGGQRR